MLWAALARTVAIVKSGNDQETRLSELQLVWIKKNVKY